MRMMRKSLLALATMFVAVSVIAAPVIVFAEQGDGTGQGSGSGTDRKSLNSEKPVAIENSTETEVETKNRLRVRGKELLERAQKERSAKPAEARKKACEARKQGLQRKIGNLVKNAEKYQARIDEVFAKATTFYSENNLSVDGYDELVVRTTNAKAQAQASVQALKSLKPTIDCTSNTVATDVATFKAAAEQARKDLRSYKQAVKSILTDLRAAKDGEDQ
ncbi:MAG: hypothetical protein AAB834_05785 [Patescibacteria group bacterium]